MKTQTYTTVFLVAIILTSCAEMLTSPPTETPASTATFTLVPPTPTITPIPTLVLSEFAPTIIEMGTHGNIVCINYHGSSDDLNKVALYATFYQNDKAIENSIPQEAIDGKTCFELKDAQYQLDTNISVKILAVAKEIELQNGEQLQDLGKYEPAPFLPPLFRLSDLGTLVLTHHNHVVSKYSEGKPFYAHDLWFGKYIDDKGTVGIPIYMLGTVKVLYYGFDEDSGISPNTDNYRMIFSLIDTGYVCIYSHVQPPSNVKFYEGEVLDYDPKVVIAEIGQKDKYSGTPHLHVECQNPRYNQSGDDVWHGFNFSGRNKGLNLPNIPNIEIENLLLTDWISD